MDTEIRTNADDATSSNSESETKNDDETFLPLVPRRPPTPEKCAVCLNNKQNDIIARIDSCSHTFCFDCILQWSKVRSICPLCKQPFSVITRERYSGDIIEEIRIASTENRSSVPRYSSLNELLVWFDEDRHRNHADLNSNHHPMAMFRQMVYVEWLNSNVSLVRRPNTRRALSMSRFRNSTSTSTTFSNIASHDSILRLLRRYLEESITELPYGTIHSQSTRHTVAFRKFIYLNRLLVRSPVVGNDQITITTRDCSPQWYASNPACLHRLVPFLTRDLLALLSNEERLIEQIVQEILTTISIHEIQSRPMIRRLSDYLGRYTKHFLHELYAFARCPYDLAGFDRHAQYSRSTRTSTRTLPIAISLDDDEQDESTPIILDDATTQIDLTLPSESTNTSESRSSSPECEIVEYLQPNRPRTPPTLIVLSEDEEQQNEETNSRKRKYPHHYKDQERKSKSSTAVSNASASSIVLDDEESMETSEQVNIED